MAEMGRCVEAHGSFIVYWPLCKDLESHFEVTPRIPPGPNEGTFPTPSFTGDRDHIGRALEIIHGEQGILQLLLHVEVHLLSLQEARIAYEGSHDATAELEAIRFEVRARLRRIDTLLEELESEL
ncbi:hypothetical protein N7452_003658 [Penicillium brevicompactum]|uniref:Uncharacterized protein n=1 Tax=Penicillium brevicompactum TaxID=5074 RepID=A0A9W9ULU0_PENBR|nr:hypothetical protein N7452_003658 [Penicillium brevicompactum]